MLKKPTFYTILHFLFFVEDPLFEDKGFCFEYQKNDVFFFQIHLLLKVDK